jgi:hypothetical protein
LLCVPGEGELSLGVCGGGVGLNEAGLTVDMESRGRSS